MCIGVRLFVIASLLFCSATLAWVARTSKFRHHYIDTRLRTRSLHTLSGTTCNATEEGTVGTSDFAELIGIQAPAFSTSKKPNQGYDYNALDLVTAGTSSLGDIMNSGLSTTFTPNLQSKNNTLSHCYGIHHPLDRMALTANGNLQRLVASYYDAPVSVVVQSCVFNGTVWDRVVHLQVADTTFCVATSVIHVHDPVCQQLVESGCVGIGQLFRFLNVLPEFQLLSAGPCTHGGFWRYYTLDCRELTCRIHEEFVANMWNIRR